MGKNISHQKIDRDTKRVAVNMINTFLVKGGSLIITLLATPAYMRYFPDDAVLGVWYAILAVLTWILYFDLGIGNGLRNRLVQALEKNDIIAQKKYISSAYCFLVFVAAILGIILLVVCKFVNWNIVFNISEEHLERNVLTNAVILVMAGILFQLILRLISSVMYAIQKAFVPNLLSLITNILILIFVIVANNTGINNDIILLSWVFLLAVNVPLIIATVVVFTTTLKDVKPHWRYYDQKCAKDVFKTGSAFLVLQVAGMIVGNSCVVYLITIFLNSASVVEFNIYYKIYGTIYMLFGVVLTPIWSAVTKSMANNNYVWVKSILKKLKIMLCICFAGQFVLLPMMQFIFNIWLGDRAIPANSLVQFVFILNNGVMMTYALVAQISNGLNELRIQMKLMVLATIILIPLSFVLTRIFPHYVSVVIAQTIALIPYCVVQNKWLNNHIDNNIAVLRNER